MLCFVGRVRELEGLSGECPFDGNQPFGQTPTARSRAALAWGKSRSPLGVGRAGGSALGLGLDLVSKKTKLHVKPRPNVTKCAVALPDPCHACGGATSQEKALLYWGSQLCSSLLLPPDLENRSCWCSLCQIPQWQLGPACVLSLWSLSRVSVFLFPQGP